jgi:calcineurin-like phosphoesterase family protein
MKIVTTNTIWITSDSHYNHKNICRGVTDWRMPDGSIPISQTRDFPNLEKMNTMIVNNINAVVGQDDVLIHLGDWSFGGFDSISEFWARLVCKNIYEFLGNHDHHIKNNKNDIRDLFVSVDKEEDQFIFAGHSIHLNHYPVMSWRDMKSGAIHLHGHTHLTGDNRFGHGKKMDVGIDGHPEFRPYNLLTEVLPLMDKRPIMSEYTTVLDHHTDKMRHKHS